MAVTSAAQGSKSNAGQGTTALNESEQNVLTERRRPRLRTIEALDPLAAFVALAAHVKHAAGDRGHGSLPAANPFPALCRWGLKETSLYLKEGTVHLLEVDFVHLELGLKDSRSQDAAAKQILKQDLSQWLSPKPTGGKSLAWLGKGAASP